MATQFENKDMISSVREKVRREAQTMQMGTAPFWGRRRGTLAIIYGNVEDVH